MDKGVVMRKDKKEEKLTTPLKKKKKRKEKIEKEEIGQNKILEKSKYISSINIFNHFD